MQGLGRAALVAFDIFLSKLLGLEVIVGRKLLAQELYTSYPNSIAQTLNS